MGQGRQTRREESMARRREKRRRRLALMIGGPLALGVLVAVIALWSRTGYSDFDVIGQRPTVVQVFLPG